MSAIVLGVALIGTKQIAKATARQAKIVNVSYDPTRELYQSLNPLFVSSYAATSGHIIAVEQSHGGSSRQAKKVASGELPADVVTLGLVSDVNDLHKRGLVPDHWEDRLPNRSTPYTSTIVFVIRGSNPHGIKDWPDLLQPGLEVVTPDPRTSGNGKLTALAAWLSIVTRGGNEADARAYLQAFYKHVPELAEGARGASTAFSTSDFGDVHVTWESEALREVAASNGKLQVVYPPVSILAEPVVTWVDKETIARGTTDAAQAYARFLFTDQAQEIIARSGYRPYKAGIAEKAGVRFKNIKLVPISAISQDWNDVADKFFSDTGIVTTIVAGLNK